MTNLYLNYITELKILPQSLRWFIMIKVNSKLAVLAVRHNSEKSRQEVVSLLKRLPQMPFKVILGLELNKQDAYYILKRKVDWSEFYPVLSSDHT